MHIDGSLQCFAPASALCGNLGFAVAAGCHLLASLE
jgi:hypothetical protein